MGGRSLSYRVSIRIRRRYFDAIRKGEKTVELRRASPYWQRRLERLMDGRGSYPAYPWLAVFFCGRRVHVRHIKEVRLGDPVDFLGREPSAEGKADLGDGQVFAIFLGGRAERWRDKVG